MSSGRRLRVLLAVSPQLLANTLARALADDQLEVVVHDDAEHDAEQEAFEVGVVTGALPPGVDVAVVVSLPADDGGTGPVRIRTDAGEREVVITDITSVRHLIEEARPASPRT